jgi:hypothetical protein
VLPQADSANTAPARAAHSATAATRSLAGVAALALLAACGGGSSTGQAAATPAASSASAGTTAPSSAAASASGQPSAGFASAPQLVAVTTAGALVVLSPKAGSVVRTLVPSGVVGDEVSVSSNGTVYFAARNGCADEVESVAATGGTPVRISAGSLPAVTPDGTKLAFASQPSLTQGCVPSNPDLTLLYKLVIRSLGTGTQTTYPMVAPGQDSGLPAPISHLSWSPDDLRLAVSIASIQDNEGWNLALVDTQTAKYYLSGAGVTDVPATGQPNARDSYLREGVYLPDGELFVSRACCAGIPVRNTSRLMWEVTTAGGFVHQVAVGFPALEHTSLSVSADGKWLLYLAATDLYVSSGGATPGKLTTGLLAAAWL